MQSKGIRRGGGGRRYRLGANYELKLFLFNLLSPAEDFWETAGRGQAQSFPCLPIFPAAVSLSLVHSSALLNGWISCLSLVQLFFCSSINVTLGAHNIQRQERTQQHIPVLRAIPHPDYDPDNFLNDIMLLQVLPTRPLALQPC